MQARVWRVAYVAAWHMWVQGRRETTLIGGRETTLIGGRETTLIVFIESPEYAIFIKFPEFYWMR